MVKNKLLFAKQIHKNLQVLAKCKLLTSKL